MRLAVIFALLVVAGPACNNSDFAGSTKRGTDDANPEVPDEDGPELGTKAKADEKQKDKKKPRDEEDDSNPNTNLGDDQSSGDPNIVDILAGLLGGDSDVAPSQPDENTIDFGTDKFFHIGDNDMDGTSCKLELSLSALAGNQFYFEFEVKKDDTDVTLEIQRICGVDYSDSNDVLIFKTSSATEVARQNLAVGDAPVVIRGKGLGVGKYMVVVEAKPNTANNSDRDDYIVGHVKLTATKPIKAGKVGAK